MKKVVKNKAVRNPVMAEFELRIEGLTLEELDQLTDNIISYVEYVGGDRATVTGSPRIVVSTDDCFAVRFGWAIRDLWIWLKLDVQEIWDRFI